MNRHPLERFLASYIDKQGNWKLGVGNLSWTQFVEKMLRTPVHNWNEHWAPIHTLCPPCIRSTTWIKILNIFVKVANTASQNLALSSHFFCMLSQSWHPTLSPLYDVLNHTNWMYIFWTFFSATIHWTHDHTPHSHTMHRYDIVARMETFEKDSAYIINRYFPFRLYMFVFMDGDLRVSG